MRLRHLFAAAILFGGAARADNATLVEAAKREGRVVWYSTLIVNQLVKPVAEAFQKKYGIPVDYVRSDGSSLVVRLLNEKRAGKVQADVFDNTEVSKDLLRENVILKWLPEPGASLPAQFYDPNGYWAATNMYVLTPGVNTDLVKGAGPRTLADLLDPQWKGRMAWSAVSRSSGAPGFVKLVFAEMGREPGLDYLKKLAGQKIAGVGVSARQLLDQVIAGEFAVGLQTYNNHSVISAAEGAPVKWLPLEPAMALYNTVQVTSGAPHMNAAKLLVSFLLSPEGQKLFRDANYLPVAPDVPPLDPSLRPDTGHFRAIFFDPADMDDDLKERQALVREIFG